MFHRTERLLLRPAWPEDWEALFGGIADRGVVRNLASAPWPYLPSHAREFVARPQSELFPHFLLTLPGEHGSQLVGCAGLGECASGVEIGYWIARRFWGQGFATEGARGVIEVAKLIGHRRIEGAHYLDNPASGRVLRKLGFTPTGVVAARDCRARGRPTDAAIYRLDLVEQDWLPLQAA